jgi:GTP cyclohydrolase I
MKENKEQDPFEENHLGSSIETPIRPDAFDLSDDEKIEAIEKHVEAILHIIGMDLTDDSLKRTPHRVAKMYVKETFAGLHPENKPKVTLFENKYQYNQMLVEKNIQVYSVCEHHLVPIIGKCHVAYISNGEVIGLSKINRIVKYFSKRPQVQERLTQQIMEELKSALKTNDVAVVIDAAHMCVATRGIEDVNSSTVTAAISGQFKDEATRAEFLKYISLGN